MKTQRAVETPVSCLHKKKPRTVDIKLGGFKVMCISLYFIRILKFLVKHLDTFVVDSKEFVPHT